MPILQGRDGIGPYYQFGKSGMKFHYNNGYKGSEEEAYHRAILQMRAIKASQSRRKKYR